jgi:hypothetical protein
MRVLAFFGVPGGKGLIGAIQCKISKDFATRNKVNIVASETSFFGWLKRSSKDAIPALGP